MKCILMNKNTEVLIAEYDSSLDGFTEVFEILNIDFAPLIVKKKYRADDFNATLSKWFRNRGIPSWRDKLDLLLNRLQIERPEELLDKSFGLSLSDQYWLKPYDSSLTYADVNFFEHDFDATEFLEASFSDTTRSISSELALKTPNNTTDGMLRKSWIVENGKRFLLKGGFRGDALQPFNEVLASEICRRLGFRHVDYVLDTVGDKLVSKCECFTTVDTEIIPAYQVMIQNEKASSAENYETYIRILEENGISSAREEVENMYILDYLIMNEDRHLNNFGIVRDVNTLEWLATAPIFDSGQALPVIDLGEEAGVEGVGRFFYEVEKFDSIIEAIEIRNPSRINWGALEDIEKYFRALLKEHQELSRISDRRIELLCQVLKSRVPSLKRLLGQ